MPKLLWLKNNEREIYEKMDYFLDVNGYLIFKTTGNMVMELSNASVFGIDLKKKDWLRWIFSYIGIDTKKLPPLAKSIDLVGKLKKMLLMSVVYLKVSMLMLEQEMLYVFLLVQVQFWRKMQIFILEHLDGLV